MSATDVAIFLRILKFLQYSNIGLFEHWYQNVR